MTSCASQRRPNLSRGTQPPTGDPGVRVRISGVFRSVIGWLRAGYPDEAPRTGYSPLLALGGPMALTARQTQRIVDDLASAPADIIDIGIAITKTTGRLPTPTQTSAIALALHPD